MAENQSTKAGPIGIALGVLIFLGIMVLLAGALFGWWQFLFR
jgi:hypothetical protein